jgi:hypothetical protein
MAQPLLSLYRPAYDSTPELAKVAAQARAEPVSSDILRQQIDFDDKISRALSSLRLTDTEVRAFESLLSAPEGNANAAESHTDLPRSNTRQSETEQESEEEQEDLVRRAPRRTILFAVAVGLVATVCMVIFLISDRLNSFEGADHVSELLDSANSLTGDEFEAVETKAGDLQDWFFLKHGLEHYAVPKQFANVKTVGCRVFKFDGANVAQIMAVTDKELLLYMFQANDLGIKIRKGKWEIVDGDDWVGAVTGLKDICFLVAFKGNRDEMKELLSKMGQ